VVDCTLWGFGANSAGSWELHQESAEVRFTSNKEKAVAMDAELKRDARGIVERIVQLRDSL
jgi:hypothetical protein